MAEPQEKNKKARSAAEIERDIDRTRAEIDETLDRIFYRLTPGQAFEQVVDYVRRSNGAATFGRTLKNNPVPVLLTTIGVSWLILAGMRERARENELIGTPLPQRDAADRSIAARMAEAHAVADSPSEDGPSPDWKGAEARGTRVFTPRAESDPGRSTVDVTRERPAGR